MTELSIVVPTFKEAENIGELVARLDRSLAGVEWEVIFVDDDSPDGTAERVRALGRTHPRVRCIHRIGRRGLSSASIEGMLSSSAPFVAVMDGDLQHDEALLPRMLELLKNGDLDVVVGSRYVEGGGLGQWDESRALLSRVATRMGRGLLRADLKDPMSGFFMIRHDVMLSSVRNGVSGIGFKILLDLFASSPKPLRFRELPFQFRQRLAGESKLDTAVAWEYFVMLLDKIVGRWVPVRFVTFSLVGALGVLVHFAVLMPLYRGLGVGFATSQTVATLVAMMSNFLLNNILTYRDAQLRGWGLVKGWISFSLACGVGAIANVGVAEFLFRRDTFWITSALSGIIVGAVWNYVVTAVYTWRRPVQASRLT
jgi:dolichol-phosphate mannosyltransferase